MQEQLEARLEELQKDFEVGEKRLRDLEAETVRLRETMLRISGAIQVVQELLNPPQAPNGAAEHEPVVSAAAPRQNSSGGGE